VKPNLFIVGAPKCGTTAWVEYLSSHPDIFFSPMKEPHYFNTDMPNYRWVKDRDAYLSLFDEAGSASVVGEASVQYLYSTEAARNISRFNPDAKILILLRDQEDFLPSLHNQIVYNGDEIITDFELAWRNSGKQDASNVGRYCREIRLLDYKAAGRFNEQIERYFDCFPAEQIRVLHFRDWACSPREAYLEILRFLGLPDDGRRNFTRVNEAQKSRVIWLTRRLRHPPLLIQGLRRTLRLPQGLGTKLQQINSRAGYLSSPSDALKQEIRDYYRDDNALVQQLISWVHCKTGQQ
jgi:hypothetical protein